MAASTHTPTFKTHTYLQGQLYIGGELRGVQRKGEPPSSASRTPAMQHPASLAPDLAHATHSTMRTHAQLRPKRKRIELQPDGLAEDYLETIMLGKLRVVDAQRLAGKTARQPNAPQDVCELAAIGGRGARPQHMERDLHARYAGTLGATVVPYTIWMDLLTTKSNLTVPLEVPFIFCTDIIAALYDAGPLQFAKSVLGDNHVDNLDTFWKNALSQPWGQKHPHLQNPEVPMVLFMASDTNHNNIIGVRTTMRTPTATYLQEQATVTASHLSCHRASDYL